MKSRLAPDSATVVGLLTAAGVYLVYNNALPNVTDVRMAPPHDGDVEAERKAAAWKSVALIGVVFLVARDINSYVISGASLLGIDWLYKHANSVHPGSGKIDATTDGTSIDAGLEASYPLPDYSDEPV